MKGPTQGVSVAWKSLGLQFEMQGGDGVVLLSPSKPSLQVIDGFGAKGE